MLNSMLTVLHNWRAGSALKGTYCFGTQFDSQHPGNLTPSSGLHGHLRTLHAHLHGHK